jgi:hypothetical protein
MDLNKGPWIAGGSARKLYSGLNWEKGDIDIFFSSKEQHDEWVNQFSSIRKAKKFIDELTWHQYLCPPYLINTSDSAKTWGYRVADYYYKIQTVHNDFYESIEKIFAKFDFHACMFVATEDLIITTDEALESVRTNTITKINHYRKDNFVQRIVKYHSHGFNIAPLLMKKALTELELENIKWELRY